MSALVDRSVSGERVKAIVFAPMSETLRTHLITLAYLDMGTEMAELLGPDDATWTSLAVWFAGGSPSVRRTPAAPKGDPLARVRREATGRLLGGRQSGGAAANRSLAAGARGVFFEVGLCWADFLATFGRSAERTDDDLDAAFEAFCGRAERVPSPPGKLWPAGNRDQMTKGFGAYLAAMRTGDAKRRAELVLLGNICLADHEQHRLQAWLDVSMLDPVRTVMRPARNLGSGGLIGTAERAWSSAMTRQVVVLQVAGETVRVGEPVLRPGEQHPAPLDTLAEPEVSAEYERIAGGAGAAASGARHWNDRDDRMRFLASLYRVKQRAGLIGISPYTPAQEVRIWAEAAEVDALDAEYEYEGPLHFPRAETPPWPPEVIGRLRAQLDEGRQECDPPIDDAIERFYRTSGIPRADRHFTDVLMEVARPAAGSASEIRRFLDEEPQLPAWADLDRIRSAQDFFASFRPSIHASLFFGSMFLGYAAANGVQVLALVSDLTNSPERRLWESTRFVEDVCTTPFWERGSDGWKSLRGVRVFHGSVRAMIESGSQHIKAEAEFPTDRVWSPGWGRPINQEDMFGYCLTMAVPTIENLDRMGAAIDPDRALDWLHLWNVVGVLMGVQEHFATSPLEPTRDLSFEEARTALDVIFGRNLAPTPQGRQLTASLVEQIGWFPGPVRRVARSFIRSSIGDRNADMLGVPEAGLLEPTLVVTQDVLRTLRQNRFYARSSMKLTEWLGREFLKWWAEEYQDTPPFRQGGVASVEQRAPDPATRMPRQISILIDSGEELPPEVMAAISLVPDVDLRQQPVDDGYERLGAQTVLQGTAAAGPTIGELVTAVRSSTQGLPSVRQVVVVVDGRTVPLSRLSDQELDQLLVELTD